MAAIRDAYLEAAASAVALLGEPAVAASWAMPSALKDFGVSGLAGHLAWQILCVPRVLADRVPDEEPVALLDHYTRSPWVAVGTEDEVHVGIRRTGEDVAAGGATALAAQAGAVVDELRDTLAAEAPDRPVHLPWAQWSLTVDDFLTTRMMEIAVHSDDLALSVGVDTPPLPPDVLDPVLALLAHLAVRRHGAPAVLRAFSRAERAPATIAAF